MIHARPEMVDYLPGKDTESRRDFPYRMQLDGELEKARIVVWDRGVCALFKEDSNFRFEVSDTLVGPF